ncbi:MAG: phosphate transport system substrate-binding protein [Mariniblastus sp.]|jgi:phosphate transport system substrate-binding protein
MSRNVCAALFCSVLVVLASGCDSSINSNNAEGGSATSNTSLFGSITIEGSSTVEPISNRAKETFNTSFPNVNISVSGQGTGNGFKALASKECDLSDASRPIKQKELTSCIEAGVNFYEVPVAYDGLTIVINNENNFVKQLTIEQLTQIFREDTAAKTWKQVNDAWPDEKISIYAPGIASGTHDYFVEVIGKKDKKGLRADDQTMLSEDDKALVTGVKGDKYAIGFFGFSYYDANKSELQAVPIVNPETEDAVTPSMPTIETGEYAPFSRPLFIYVNTESYQRAEVKEFVDNYLENIVDVVKDAGYVPLPNSIYEAVKERIAKDMPGSHYLDADGNKREGSLTEVFQASNLPQ